MKIRTKAVISGTVKDLQYNSVITPIYPTSIFRFTALGKNAGYDYSRSGNPTRSALEENIASLEGGIGARATATGMAAITTAMFLLEPGDHIVTGNDIYGGTYRLFKDIFTRQGISFSFINMMNIDEVKNAIRPNTRMIWIETPSNPLLHIVDLKSIIGLAKRYKILTACDNTFLSPYFQRPFEFGADLVIHSTTKYLNGHSDIVGGAIVYRAEEIGEKIRYLVNALGVSQSPYDSWLVLRGIKTLPQRMEAHQANAMKIAAFLEKNPRVKKIYYTGLKSHPQRALIKKQMYGFGGMLAFELDTKTIPLEGFFKRVKLFQLAESLGGVESLIEHPWSMSHVSMGKTGLIASGITKETVRISVGIEDAEDLIEDLKNGLRK